MFFVNENWSHNAGVTTLCFTIVGMGIFIQMLFVMRLGHATKGRPIYTLAGQSSGQSFGPSVSHGQWSGSCLLAFASFAALLFAGHSFA